MTTTKVNLTRAETTKVLEKLIAIPLEEWKLIGKEEKLPDKPEYLGPTYEGGPCKVKTVFEFTKEYSTNPIPALKVVVQKRTKNIFI